MEIWGSVFAAAGRSEALGVDGRGSERRVRMREVKASFEVGFCDIGCSA